MIAILKSEKGVTLLEVLATGIIVLVALISIYTGIIYADKQVQRNYHDRVATLHASGEIEWQMFYFKNYKVFDTFTNKTVLIDKLKRGNLNGQMTARRTDTFENPFGVSVPYNVLEVTVSWVEPGDNRTRRIVVREDFY
jgi:Tfp pilus assembly protein PilV